MAHLCSPALRPDSQSYRSRKIGHTRGEDADYCLRCHLADFPVCTAGGSFVLHFVGKSTWRDGRPAENQAAHLLAMRKVFVDKWGTALADMALEEKYGVFESDPALRAAFEQGDYRRLIASLQSRARQ